MAFAIIERQDLREIGYSLYELWELDGEGEKRIMRRMSPVTLVEGRRLPADVQRAKNFLHIQASLEGLEIIREDD
jgi:hypothetical protein